VAKTHHMVLIVPWFEEAQTGVYYNSAVVIERDGTVVGKYRKTHIPHVGPCFWEKFYFKPGNLGYPVFDTSVGKVGLIICYDRHFPEIGRALGLKGAELVFNPSATVESLSKYLWELEQSARSTGWAPRSRFRARSSTARRISATRAARSWRRPPTPTTRCSCTTSTSR
jgi:beta-ureidopropionase